MEDGLFYRKMMKNKLDMGLLAPIIRLVCFNDGRMSRVLAEVLLKAMNSNEEIEDKTVVFAVPVPRFRTLRPTSRSTRPQRVAGQMGAWDSPTRQHPFWGAGVRDGDEF